MRRRPSSRLSVLYYPLSGGQMTDDLVRRPSSVFRLAIRQFVGWVERSDTHHTSSLKKAMGFACAQPILHFRSPCQRIGRNWMCTARGFAPLPPSPATACGRRSCSRARDGFITLTNDRRNKSRTQSRSRRNSQAHGIELDGSYAPSMSATMTPPTRPTGTLAFGTYAGAAAPGPVCTANLVRLI
jgi:hypothetical protein